MPFLHKIRLFLFCLGIASPVIAMEKKVTLRAHDGQNVAITLKEALQSRTVQDLLNEAGDHEPISLELAGIKGQTLRLIFEKLLVMEKDSALHIDMLDQIFKPQEDMFLLADTISTLYYLDIQGDLVYHLINFCAMQVRIKEKRNEKVTIDLCPQLLKELKDHVALICNNKQEIMVHKNHILLSGLIKNMLEDISATKKIQEVHLSAITSEMMIAIFGHILPKAQEAHSTKEVLQKLLHDKDSFFMVRLIRAVDYLDIQGNVCDILLDELVKRIKNMTENELENILPTIQESIPNLLPFINQKLFEYVPVKPINITSSLILAGHTGPVLGALTVELENEQRIISWSADHTVRIWDMEAKLRAILVGHTGPVRGALIVATDGEKRIVSWSNDHTLRIWNMDGNPLAICKDGHKDFVQGALIIDVENEQRILSWSYDHTLCLWNPQGKLLTTYRGHLSPIQDVVVVNTEHGKNIISWSQDRNIRIWDTEGQLNANYTLPQRAIDLQSYIEGALVVDTEKIIFWSSLGEMHICDMQGNILNTWLAHNMKIIGIVAVDTQDGKIIISWSGDCNMRIWNMHGNLITECTEHTSWINKVLVGDIQGEKRIISCAADNTIRIWSLQGKLLTTLKDTDEVYGIAIIENGKKIVSWSNPCVGYKGGTVRVWDMSGNLLVTYVGHTKTINGALVINTPQGEKALSWSSDNTLRIWDILNMKKKIYLADLQQSEKLLNIFTTHFIKKENIYNISLTVLKVSYFL